MIFTNFDENLATLHDDDVHQETTNSVLIDVEREQQCNTKENELESMGQKENNNDLESKESDNDEEDDDLLTEFRAAVNETCLQSIAPALPPHTKVIALCLDLLEPT